MSFTVKLKWQIGVAKWARVQNFATSQSISRPGFVSIGPDPKSTSLILNFDFFLRKINYFQYLGQSVTAKILTLPFLTRAFLPFSDSFIHAKNPP